jgi:hypothetical protein
MAHKVTQLVTICASLAALMRQGETTRRENTGDPLAVIVDRERGMR